MKVSLRNLYGTLKKKKSFSFYHLDLSVENVINCEVSTWGTSLREVNTVWYGEKYSELGI